MESRSGTPLLPLHRSSSFFPKYFILPGFFIPICTRRQGLHEQIHLPFSLLLLRNYIQIKWVTTNIPAPAERENWNIPAIPLTLRFCPEVWPFVLDCSKPLGRLQFLMFTKDQTINLKNDASGLASLLISCSWWTPWCGFLPFSACASLMCQTCLMWELSDCCPGWWVSSHAKQI